MEKPDFTKPMQATLPYVDIYHDDDTVVVVLKGPLNTVTVESFHERIEELLQEGIGEHMILDFSDVDYVSSVGLKVILDLGKYMRQEGGTLSLVSDRTLVREIFEASGFTMLFGLYTSIEQAKAEGLNHNSATEE